MTETYQKIQNLADTIKSSRFLAYNCLSFAVGVGVGTITKHFFPNLTSEQGAIVGGLESMAWIVYNDEIIAGHIDPHRQEANFGRKTSPGYVLGTIAGLTAGSIVSKMVY